jgi:hypothetical protein
VEAWLLGWNYWREAGDAVNRQQEILEAWDPAAIEMQYESMRRQLMAQDREGYLFRARQAAQRAIWLARSREEAFRGTALLALVEHEAGHHQAELRDARRLLSLRPHSPLALMYLQRAEKCTEPAAWPRPVLRSPPAVSPLGAMSRRPTKSALRRATSTRH